MGSTDNSQSSTRLADHPDSTRQEPSDSSKSKDTSYTESESEEEEERGPSIRVPFTVSQFIRVSPSSRRLDRTDLLPRRRLVEDAPTWESSTLIGLVKMPPTN